MELYLILALSRNTGHPSVVAQCRPLQFWIFEAAYHCASREQSQVIWACINVTRDARWRAASGGWSVVTTRVEASVMEQSFSSRALENVPSAAWRCKQL